MLYKQVVMFSLFSFESRVIIVVAVILLDINIIGLGSWSVPRRGDSLDLEAQRYFRHHGYFGQVIDTVV